MNGHEHLVRDFLAPERQTHVLPVAHVIAHRLDVPQAGAKQPWRGHFAQEAHFFALVVGIEQPVRDVEVVVGFRMAPVEGADVACDGLGGAGLK